MPNRWMSWSAALLAGFVLLALAISQGIGSAGSGCALAHASVPPARGHVEFGVQLNPKSGSPSPQAYAQQLGRVPSIDGLYASLPMSAQDKLSIRRVAHSAAGLGASMMITIGSARGLEMITPRVADDLARFLAGVAGTTPLFVRFGWEMNGSWYPWGQQPIAFVRAFREVSAAVHRRTTRARMVWAPNVGTGYPFPDGTYSARPGSDDYALLDTNHDGRLDSADNSYAPYYPGNRYVDWVGLTLTYYGRRWPWTQNVVPEPGAFRAQLTGTYNGAGGDWRQVPNFYACYSAAHHKPLMIAETSALYLPHANSGATDLQIKQGWWNQLFARDTPAEFPNLRAILWFEQDKYESNLNAYASWAITPDPVLSSAFRRALPTWLTWGHVTGARPGAGRAAPRSWVDRSGRD